MRFEPRPRNDYREFIDLYFEECRARSPRLEAIAGKWTFEDLIPGLSDFDTRFIVNDDTTREDWRRMSTEVGEAHLDICRRYPHWARNLEHLPGINLTWRELTSADSYYPEYPQWTFYRSTDPARLQAAETYLGQRAWNWEDEYFHLKKFCLYYGRYDRRIDPPVNLGPFENKYVMHSRFMHYFCPPLQSAVCILLKRPVRGKMETIGIAGDMFPDVAVFREMQRVVGCHYEAPGLYEEPELTRLEDRLESALEFLRDRIALELTVISAAPGDAVESWRAALKDVVVDPALRIFDAAKFCRLMKGRLQFYASAPAHFDSTWPIENELRRLRQSFFVVPFREFWKERTGRAVENPIQILPELCPGVISREELRCVEEFNRLLPGQWEDGEQRRIAQAVADIFDGVFSALEKISQAIRCGG